jgi:hypothetical protein
VSLPEARALCAPMWPAEIDTNAGLKSDTRGRVLTSEGRPVEGLYVLRQRPDVYHAGYLSGLGYPVAIHAAGRPTP